MVKLLFFQMLSFGHIRHVPFLGFFFQPRLPAARDTANRHGPDGPLQHLKPPFLRLGSPDELLTAVPTLHLFVSVPHRRPVRIVGSLLGDVGLDGSVAHLALAAIILKLFALWLDPVGEVYKFGWRWVIFAHGQRLDKLICLHKIRCINGF
jgi:hypothetical protein